MSYPDLIRTPEEYISWIKTLAGGVMSPVRYGETGMTLSCHTMRRGSEVHRWSRKLTDAEDEALRSGADPRMIAPDYYRGDTPANQLLMLEMG